MKLSPALFRKAAQRIDSEESSCCCYAIQACRTRGFEALDYFTRLFRPPVGNRCRLEAYWMHYEMRRGEVVRLFHEETKQRRVIALLLCADILAASQRQKKKS